MSTKQRQTFAEEEYELNAHIARKKKTESRSSKSKIEVLDEFGFDDEEEANDFLRYIKK